VAPRVWVSSGFLEEREVLRLAPEVERCGFHGMTFPDHLVLPVTEPGRYPYSADGKPPFRDTTPWPDPLVLAGAVGATTKRLHVMTTVLVAPLRHPIVLAKAAATAARLAEGRLVLGLGVGWQREEFEALDVAFGQRGARTTETIGALRELWGPAPSEYRGSYVGFGAVRMEPSPPPIPVVLGGASDAALRRAVRMADGWVLPTGPLERVPGELDRLDAALAEAGRDRDDFEVFVPCVNAGADEILPVLERRVEHIVVMPWPYPGLEDSSFEAKVDSLERWQTEIGARV
jgi:probable F420-dependent oxidoreductase